MIGERAALVALVAGQLATGMLINPEYGDYDANDVVTQADKIVGAAIALHPVDAEGDE